jgi:protein-tyrosine-phosphatase
MVDEVDVILMLDEGEDEVLVEVELSKIPILILVQRREEDKITVTEDDLIVQQLEDDSKGQEAEEDPMVEETEVELVADEVEDKVSIGIPILITVTLQYPYKI